MQAADPGSREAPEHIAIIRERYLAEADGNALLALDRAILDGLADLCEAHRQAELRAGVVSRGFARGGALDWEA